MTLTTLPRYKHQASGLCYSRQGSGSPLVFLHGVGLRAEAWWPQIEAFSTDYQIYAIDMPGHGESPCFEHDKPVLADYVAKLASFFDTELTEPAVVIGHSMGALLALSLASKHPNLVKAVVPLNTIYQRSNEAKTAVMARANSLRTEHPLDLASAPVKRWFGETPTGTDSINAELCRAWLENANLRGYADAYSVFSTVDGISRSALKELTQPVLFITGTDDANSSPAMSERMAEETQNGKALIIQGARHMAPMTHAEEINHAILRFINGQSPSHR